MPAEAIVTKEAFRERLRKLFAKFGADDKIPPPRGHGTEEPSPQEPLKPPEADSKLRPLDLRF